MAEQLEFLPTGKVRRPAVSQPLAAIHGTCRTEANDFVILKVPGSHRRINKGLYETVPSLLQVYRVLSSDKQRVTLEVEFICEFRTRPPSPR